MAGNVIAGFLVRLGFLVDKDEAKKFQGTVDSVSKGMQSLTKKGIAFGVAFTGAVAKANSEVTKLYNLANRTGSSISGLKALGSAMETVGGSAEDINGAIAQLSDNIKYLNYEPVINSLGVSLRDAQGNARDMTDVMLDLRSVLASMPQQQAKVYAEMLGLGGAFEAIMKQDFPTELKRSKDLLGGLSVILDKNHESTRQFSNEFGRLWEVIATGAQSASSELTALLGLDTKLADLNSSLAKGLEDFIKWQSEIIKGSDSFWDWLSKSFFEPTSNFASETRKETLAPEVEEVLAENRPDGFKNQGGELIQPKSEKKEIELIQPKRSERSLELNKRILELSGDEVFSDEKTLVDTVQNETPQKLEERVIEVIKEKPNDVGFESLKQTINGRVENDYFKTPIASRMGDTITNNSSTNTVNQGAKNITVNQNINITGVNDPERIKREISPAPVIYNQVQSAM